MTRLGRACVTFFLVEEACAFVSLSDGLFGSEDVGESCVWMTRFEVGLRESVWLTCLLTQRASAVVTTLPSSTNL